MERRDETGSDWPRAVPGPEHAPHERARALQLEGIPADRIVRAAKSQGVDLVVIGTHGRAGFSRLVLGSVASCVISQARCAVLTVRGR